MLKLDMDASKILLLLIEGGISLYLIFSGLMILRNKKKYLSFPQKISLWLIGLIHGKDQAIQKRAELTDENRQTYIGRRMIAIGFTFLFLTIYSIFVE